MESGVVDTKTGFLYLKIDYWLSFNDQAMIVRVFKENFNLSVTSDIFVVGSYRIYLFVDSISQVDRLLRIIKPYLLPEFFDLLFGLR